MTLVEAPNYTLYEHWLERQPDPGAYSYLKDWSMLAGWWGPIVVLNGGSLDPHIRSQVNHPGRRGNVTNITV